MELPVKRIFRFGAVLATLTAVSTGILTVGVEAKGVAPKAGALTDWPTVVSPIRKDPAMERKIAEIVAGMTLEQKVGQMTQAEIRSITPDQARKYYIGSILNGGGAWPYMNKHASVADWATVSAQFYKASMSSDMKTPIPVIWGTDAVHGHNNVFGAVLYPHNIGLGATRDPQLIGEIARRTAATVRATGITWVFAPTLAVVQNPRWGRTYESYSSDPRLVREYAQSYVGGLQGNLTDGTAAVATAKHYMGDGGTFNGTDQGENRSSRSDMINIHGQGYYGALEAGAQTVMASYNSWNDVGAGTNHGKMHGATYMLTEVLKGKMGFDGLVVSDWNAIEQIPGCERAHCPQTINAGVDLVMVPDDWHEFIVATVKDVKAGAIPMSRIDDAVTRILRVKMRSGLFDTPPAASALNGRSEAVNNEADRALARRAVRKSLVLLKNNNRSLPLRSESRILVVGTGAASIDRQTGGWSMTWQGDENVASDFPNATNFLTAVRGAVKGTVDYSPDGRDVDVSKYDAVIAVASETPYAEMKGDVSWPASLQHSDRYPGDLAMLKAVSGKGVPVITVMFSGRPTYANDLINLSDAFVAAWLPGTEAQGITDALFGSTADFQGRLSFDWPGVACPDTSARAILFRRGYGLSYAKPRKMAKLAVRPAPTGCNPDRK
jgi:beta-glucosidase